MANPNLQLDKTAKTGGKSHLTESVKKQILDRIKPILDQEIDKIWNKQGEKK